MELPGYSTMVNRVETNREGKYMKFDLRELSQRDVLLILEYTEWRTVFELMEEMERIRHEPQSLIDASEDSPKVAIQKMYQILRVFKEDGWVECRCREETSEVVALRSGCRRLEWRLSKRGSCLRNALNRFMEHRVKAKVQGGDHSTDQSVMHRE